MDQAGLSSRRLSFDLRPMHVGFMMDKLALYEMFLRLILFSPVSTIPPKLQNHFHLYDALVVRASR
jgi:hypothetical protein